MKRGNAGFTLVEMMVALAIGGIMTAMAVPNFSEMREGYRLRATTLDVFAALQRARSEAVKRNNNYQFSLVSNATYRLHDDADNDGVIDAGETVTLKNITSTAQGTKFPYWSWSPPLNFTPDGMTTAAAWGSWVAVTNAQGDMKWIFISRTGRISIF
jgi:prepilin-type N-terminal cleavage/methylation domain-containing protein